MILRCHSFGPSLQMARPGQTSGLSVGLEGHLHRKMVTDGKSLKGEGAESQRSCVAACPSSAPLYSGSSDSPETPASVGRDPEGLGVHPRYCLRVHSWPSCRNSRGLSKHPSSTDFRLKHLCRDKHDRGHRAVCCPPFQPAPPHTHLSLI